MARGEDTEDIRGRGWVACGSEGKRRRRERSIIITFFFILFQNP